MEIPRHWRLKAQRYRLEGSACPNCGQLSFPPWPVCAQCHCNASMAGLTGWGLPVLPPAMGITDMEPHIRYRVPERMIR
jgi:hypothetical protein